MHTARGWGRGPSATAFSKWLIRSPVSNSRPDVVSSGDPASERPGVTETTLLPTLLHWPLFGCSSQEHCLLNPISKGLPESLVQGGTPAEDEGGPPSAQQMQPQGHAQVERATWGVRDKDRSQSAQDHLEGSWGGMCV